MIGDDTILNDHVSLLFEINVNIRVDLIELDEPRDVFDSKESLDGTGHFERIRFSLADEDYVN